MNRSFPSFPILGSLGSLGSSALTNFFGVVDLRFAAAPEGQPAVRMPCLPPLNTKHGENRGSTVKSVMKHGEISGKKQKKMEALVTLVGKLPGTDDYNYGMGCPHWQKPCGHASVDSAAPQAWAAHWQSSTLRRRIPNLHIDFQCLHSCSCTMKKPLQGLWAMGFHPPFLVSSNACSHCFELRIRSSRISSKNVMKWSTRSAAKLPNQLS